MGLPEPRAEHKPSSIFDDADTSLAFARAICGVSCGSELLPPDVERDFVEAIRKLTNRMNYLACKSAFAQEVAEAYHHDPGGNVTMKLRYRRGAPAVVLDAVIYSCREHGVSNALDLPGNIHRVRSMSSEQRRELNSRIQKLIDQGDIRP